MTASGRNRDAEGLADEALDRLIHLHSGRASEADWDDWHRWQAESAQQAAAARDAEALWQGVGQAGPAWARQRRDRRISRRALVLGGGLALTGGALYQGDILGPQLLADHRTAIAQRRDIRLGNGTRITMDARTALSEDTLGARAAVQLHRGRIALDAQPDRAALTLRAGPLILRTTDEALDLDRHRDGVTVTALSNVLTLEAAGQILRLPAHSRIRIDEDGHPGHPAPVDVATEAAWRRGKLIFDRRPLADLAAEIERYRGGRILIPAADIAALEVTGIFDLDDPDGMLDSMALSLPVRIRRLPLLAIIQAA